MIAHEDYDCRETGECYLTYRRRMQVEQAQFEAERPIRQTNKEWLDEYISFAPIYASGIRKRPGETSEELKTRFESYKERDSQRNG